MSLKFNEYVDPNHKYYILAPLNEEGIEQLNQYNFYDKNGGINNNFIAMEFDEETFLFMESRLFDFLNVKMDLLINMYEEEIIENDQLPIARGIIIELQQNSDNTRFMEFSNELLRLIDVAIDKKTKVGFYF